MATQRLDESAPPVIASATSVPASVPENKTAMLSRMRLLRDVPRRTLDRLAVAVVRREYKRGERIFSQGDEGDYLYLVASGRVRIDAVGIMGQEVTLNEVRDGDCFGEIAVLDGLPRTAGATASTSTVLLALHRRQFRDLLDAEPGLATRLLGLVCERLRWSAGLYEDSEFLASPARLAKRVLDMAVQLGYGNAGEVELRISQSDLARFLGISRKSVNQHLHHRKARGWVRVSRACLLIRDAEALRRIAAGQSDP